MPIMTRRYHIRKINEYLEKKAEAEEKAANSSSRSINPKTMNVPDFVSKVKK
jgi:hypothetical protein